VVGSVWCWGGGGGVCGCGGVCDAGVGSSEVGFFHGVKHLNETFGGEVWIWDFRE